jgi:phosphoribosylformylglycinamidine synthase
VNVSVRAEFEAFFARTDTFTLGVCNGCQMFAALKAIVPGAAAWPRFVRNRSEQFEARLSAVRLPPSRSLFFAGMEESVLPIAVAHGEGRAEFASEAHAANARSLVVAQYVDNLGRPTQRYPANPNGSPDAIAGLTNEDGRVTILMPHPERVHRTVQCSWHPDEWGEDGPWMRMFRNARVWVG